MRAKMRMIGADGWIAYLVVCFINENKKGNDGKYEFHYNAFMIGSHVKAEPTTRHAIKVFDTEKSKEITTITTQYDSGYYDSAIFITNDTKYNSLVTTAPKRHCWINAVEYEQNENGELVRKDDKHRHYKFKFVFVPTDKSPRQEIYTLDIGDSKDSVAERVLASQDLATCFSSEFGRDNPLVGYSKEKINRRVEIEKGYFLKDYKEYLASIKW